MWEGRGNISTNIFVVKEEREEVEGFLWLLDQVLDDYCAHQLSVLKSTKRTKLITKLFAS